MHITGIHHVQLAMPPGGEAAAVEFYEGVLGIPHVAKPANLAVRGGCWFERGALRIHLGIEAGFVPAQKAHPALVVDELTALVDHLSASSVAVRAGEPLDGFEHVYVDDPFGNRIELIAPREDR
jgi:catechol 2,3-dioxygenase-like lactoylglutathione lyase family enzyme